MFSLQTKLFTTEVLNRLQVTEDDLQDETISDDETVTEKLDKRQSVVSTRGKKIRKAGQHQFEEHTFKKPKFCYYCKGLIKGKSVNYMYICAPVVVSVKDGHCFMCRLSKS